ncbi:LacI family DNA-binding transcriptional regulator [Ruficoccus sp. ZRK36]|uniref:LacI family DNA-binding transcriptional regulator n=1 Tax=Ruficoccus sp. ZRK36 TaxID=2866311 RepID=UPI001C729F4A|nr:LacI family DNA-binding transcriptional regulator [Ruficoccus sp. ZRK36]QYY35642.1 LacI family DNA-binding transcriptional regulator [Ruficoccus sp. ZRK36]
MSQPSLRQIAAQLGVSASTVSRALHGDPRISEKTAERVQQALGGAGYQLDPVVSAGLSRVRQKNFYRETLAWCGDAAPDQMPWLEPFFESLKDYGTRLGYDVQHFHFSKPTAAALKRMASVWRARGIRGVILGPFVEARQSLPFPWEDLSWVRVGDTLMEPGLHAVGRDYRVDIEQALAWLKSRGCRRPGFVVETDRAHVFRRPLMQAAMMYEEGAWGRKLFYELDPEKPEGVVQWLHRTRPDGLVLSWQLSGATRSIAKALGKLPRVQLSPSPQGGEPGVPYFTARYPVIGQSAVNLLHRMLGNAEYGLPAYRQTVMLSSVWSDADSSAP